jgi:hypothetical protein
MNVLPQRHRKVATVDAASDGQIEDPMLREKDAFRVQFLYMSPLGITRPIEGTTILARDLASAVRAVSRMRTWPCDADAVRIVDAAGCAPTLIGRTAREQAIIASCATNASPSVKQPEVYHPKRQLLSR